MQTKTHQIAGLVATFTIATFFCPLFSLSYLARTRRWRNSKA